MISRPRWPFRLCLAALAGWLAGAAPAGDWAQWGGVNARNMTSSEKRLPTTFRAGTLLATGGLDPKSIRGVRWVAELGSMTFGNPTVAGGRVIIGTNDRFYDDPRVKRSRGGLILCLDETTGKVVWRLPVPRYRKKVHGSGFDDLNVGVCSAATIEGRRAYVVTNRAEVLCLDLAGQADGNDGPFKSEGQYMARPGREPVAVRPGDGDIIWRFDMIEALPSAPHDATNCSVLAVGNLLYVGTANGVHRLPTEPNPLPDAASLIVLNKATGRLLAIDDEKIGRRVFHGQWSSPSACKVGGRTLVLFGAGDGVLYAFAPPRPARGPTRAIRAATLEKVWWYDCNPPRTKRDAAGKAIDYWAGDASRCDMKPDFLGPSEIIGTPVPHAGRVYVAVGRDPDHGVAPGILHCIDPGRTGDVTKTGCVWSYDKIARTMSTASVGGGLVYIADLAGAVHCLDAKTGRVQWVHQTKEPIWGSTLLADGKVYVGTQRSRLWVFRAGRQKQVLATIKLRAKVAATPVAANGTLFLATYRRLYAIRGER